MWFDLGRSEGFPTQYGPNRTPVTVDVLEVGLILAAVILLISFYVSLLSTRKFESICQYLRVTVSIFIGTCILLGNYGQEWEVAHITTKTPYKAGLPAEIDAAIGVKIGLRSVNITLHSNTVLQREQIDYNERFEWTWSQGRFGFGPYSGHIQQEFRAAQYRGVPTPILWIADYFVIDGEGQRFGRFYRTAGWYAHISIWSAFPCWILANIFSRTVIRYCGYSLGLCGVFQLLSNLLWTAIRNPFPLVIPFEDATITMKYGSSFWLTFSSGIICLASCVIIAIADRFWPFQLHNFFGVSVLKSVDEKYLTYEESEKIEQSEHKSNGNHPDVHEMEQMRPVLRRKPSVVRVKRNTNTILKPALPPRMRTNHQPFPSRDEPGTSPRPALPPRMRRNRPPSGEETYNFVSGTN